MLLRCYDELKTSGRGQTPDWMKIAERMGMMRNPSQYRKRFMRVLYPQIMFGNATLTGKPWPPEEVGYSLLHAAALR